MVSHLHILPSLLPSQHITQSQVPLLMGILLVYHIRLHGSDVHLNKIMYPTLDRYTPTIYNYLIPMRIITARVRIIQFSELVIAFSILIREISLETFVAGSVRVLAAGLAVLLVTGVKFSTFRLRDMVDVGVASIPDVLTFQEDIGHLAVQSLSQDPSREKNHQ